MKIYEEQISLQAKRYEEIAKNSSELRRFKHDYQNLLIGVRKLIENGDSSAALEILDKENSFYFKNAYSMFDTGNGIVDAILTEKQEKAKSVNATISFEGGIATEKIAATDLCVIFGNTLDNAIEACEKLQRTSLSQINVTCRSAGEYVFVNIRNPVDGNIPLGSENIQTSKDDKINHGFGLYSLRKSIEKYGGCLNLHCDNMVFSVDLELDIST